MRVCRIVRHGYQNDKRGKLCLPIHVQLQTTRHLHLQRQQLRQRGGQRHSRRALVRNDEELRRQQKVVGRMQVNERRAGLPNWLTISPQKPSPKFLQCHSEDLPKHGHSENVETVESNCSNIIGFSVGEHLLETRTLILLEHSTLCAPMAARGPVSSHIERIVGGLIILFTPEYPLGYPVRKPR